MSKQHAVRTKPTLPKISQYLLATKLSLLFSSAWNERSFLGNPSFKNIYLQLKSLELKIAQYGFY